MIIERNLSKYIVFCEDSLVSALRRMNENKSRVVFSVSETGKLEGVLTDGDVRRWLTGSHHVNLDVAVSLVSNKQFTSLPLDASHDEIEATFSERIQVIPLLDKHHHLVAIAKREPAEMRIGDFVIADDQPAFIIAEIGNNHNGSLELAYRMVDEAIGTGADCAKFQMRDMASLYRNEGNPTDSSEDLGAQYTLDLLSRFQLSSDDMFKVFDYCKQRGIMPLCTPWDRESLERLDRYGMPAFKLASADLTNHDLLEAMARTGRPLICSTGMSNEGEIVDAVRVLRRLNAKYVLLHCNSTYPAPFKDIHLNYIDRLKRIGDCPVGYSGHERGIAVAIAAVAKGARVVEKHFTLDRNMEGNDHRVSLLPDEFKAMVQGIREVEEALGAKETRRVTQGEMMNREVLGKSLVINRDLKRGETIADEMIETRSPGKGLTPYRKRELVGLAARRDFKAGDFFFPSDVDAVAVSARNYRFNRPFGIPVRYHDMGRMAAASNFDLLEFHLSYKDLDEPLEKYFSGTYDLDLVVHSPELFAGDHIMDLCSPDPAYREHSIRELQRVVDVTRRLAPYFSRARRPPIIINAGGFSLDGFIPKEQHGELYDLIAQSLSQVDSAGVEIIPQTMPPYPWHFGGQRYHNLLVSADDIKAFCEKHGYRICLDVSHSQLSCSHLGVSFKDFLEEVAGYSAHLHIVDAEGVDGEGLQIGEGSMDFGMVADVLKRKAPDASFIPEIWQGHKNEGEGFWVALDRLETWF
ncbi:N-acetylneuraminate synthase family protein [Rhizobium wuzhouense]|uniref:Acetylneuraminic acid synthetase n=1 Tax=Rhizobium wuzhouense TaxID=1986026 RepID=A0ABX5NW37_9HYPH|nr:N-acetylneuraminate synthase family protein [Rhizobium wuzhouense]PYB77106.1 acetylneuraminic acid synthetase [Rhizobium wuzhouense]